MVGRPTPSPELSPAAAVRTRLDALATDDEPVENAGAGTAYNFASPANRAATGLLPRFVVVAAWLPTMDHREAVAGPVERSGDRATQRVTLTGPDGRTETYLFGLSV